MKTFTLAAVVLIGLASPAAANHVYNHYGYSPPKFLATPTPYQQPQIFQPIQPGIGFQTIQPSPTYRTQPNPFRRTQACSVIQLGSGVTMVSCN